MLNFKNFIFVFIGFVCVSCSVTNQKLGDVATQAIGAAIAESTQEQETLPDQEKALKDIASDCTQATGVWFAASSFLQEWERAHAEELEALLATS